MNGVDGVLIVMLLVGGFLGLRFSRGFTQLTIIFLAGIFALSIAAYFTAGVLKLSPIQTFQVVALIFAFLFALPLFLMFKLRVIDNVELNFPRGQMPIGFHLGGGALMSLAICWILIVVIMECVVLASLGAPIPCSCSTSGLLWDIWTSTLTITGANFINWFTGVQGLVLFLLLGAAFIFLAIRGPKVAGGTIWDDAEREASRNQMKSKLVDHMLEGSPGREPDAFSKREYYERQAEAEQAGQPQPVVETAPPPSPVVPDTQLAAPDEPEPAAEPEPIVPAPAVEPQPVVDESSPAAEHLRQAEKHEKSGALDRALEAYGRAIEADTGCALAYFNRGQLYMFRRKKAEAAADFRKVKELSGDPSLASQAEARLAQLGI
jgi:hypothetical protein